MPEPIVTTPRALNDIRFSKTNGGLGRGTGSDDATSGLLFVLKTIPGEIAHEFEATAVNDLFVRKFTHPSQLADVGIVWTEPGPDDDNSRMTADALASNILYYHITEYFRMNPGGALYVGLDTSGILKVDPHEEGKNDIIIMQLYAGGEIRQIGVACRQDFVILNDIQETCSKLEKLHMPLSVVVTSDKITLEGDIPFVPSEGMCNVSILTGLDLDHTLVAATGFEPGVIEHNYWGCIGTCIGTISKASVHECIAWVGKFPLGLKAPGLNNGILIRDVAESTLEALNGRRAIFVRTHVGDADNYFNDSHTMDLETSDYAYIENVRTIDKACRGVRKKILPWLNSPLDVDAETGQLDSGMVSFLETIAGEALTEMENAGELIGYEAVIDPDQNVLSTSEVEVVIQNVPKGVMRKVHVKIGFASSLS